MATLSVGLVEVEDAVTLLSLGLVEVEDKAGTGSTLLSLGSVSVEDDLAAIDDNGAWIRAAGAWRSHVMWIDVPDESTPGLVSEFVSEYV